MMTGILEDEGLGAGIAVLRSGQRAPMDAPTMQRADCDDMQTMPLESVLYHLLVRGPDRWSGAAWAAALGADSSAVVAQK